MSRAATGIERLICRAGDQRPPLGLSATLPLLTLAAAYTTVTITQNEEAAKEKSLKEMVDAHKAGIEGWPWLWTQRNSDGPHYVFVGVTKDTLLKCQQISSACPQHNILLIADESEIDKYATADDFYKARCAIHDAKPIEIDWKNKILLLGDERLVEFDELVIV
jgi:hypothetical protein